MDPYVQQHAHVELLEMMTQILVTLVTTLVNVVLDQMMMTVPHVTIILIGMMDNVFQLAQMDIIKMILLILVRDVMDHA
jgi:hypothetical protein